MRFTETQIVRAIRELLLEKKIDEVSLRRNVISFLKKRRLFGKERKILSSLEREMDAVEGRVKVTVFSARMLEPKEQKVVEDRVEELFPEKKLELVFREKPELIGGIAFETDNVRYDATLARSLRLLSQSL